MSRTNEPLVRYEVLIPITNLFVFAFVFVFVLAHEQAISKLSLSEKNHSKVSTLGKKLLQGTTTLLLSLRMPFHVTYYKLPLQIWEWLQRFGQIINAHPVLLALITAPAVAGLFAKRPLDVLQSTITWTLVTVCGVFVHSQSKLLNCLFHHT